MTEADFKLRLFVPSIQPKFKILPEMQLRHRDGHTLYIDYLARPMTGSNIEPGIYGFECKATLEDLSGTFKQAIDYTHSTINDPRCPHLNGQPMRYVFVAIGTAWNIASSPIGNEAHAFLGGILRLAGKFGVGIVGIKRYAGLSLFVGADKWWDEDNGHRADAGKWHSRVQIGSGTK